MKAREEGEEDEEKESELETHREKRQRIAAASSQPALSKRQLNNTAFHTSLNSGGPASAMPAPLAQKAEKSGYARANNK
jgi:hypothetical protein